MRASRGVSAERRWPFWLLIVAWVCANSPQVAVYAALTWLAEARTFSHQQDLTREVAHLLVGEKAESRVAKTLARLEAAEAETKKATPSVPASATVKKLDLATEEIAAARPARTQGIWRWRTDGSVGRAWRAEPAHGPPRWTRV